MSAVLITSGLSMMAYGMYKEDVNMPVRKYMWITLGGFVVLCLGVIGLLVS